MATVLPLTIPATSGTVFGGFSGRQAIAVHSDGTYLAATKDGVVGPRTIKVFSSADRGTTWTLRATLTAPVDIDAIAIAQFADGSLGIVARAYDRLSLRYIKVVYGTWATGSWETVTTFTTYTAGYFDVDVSDNGVVLVVVAHTNGSTTQRTRLSVRSTGGTWSDQVNDNLITGGSSTINVAGQDVSVCALASSGGVLNVVVAAAGATRAVDTGIKVYSCRITEATGAIGSGTSGWTERINFDQNTIDTNVIITRLHRVRLWRFGNEVLVGSFTVRKAGGSDGPRFTHQRFSWAGTAWAVTRSPWVRFLAASENRYIYDVSLSCDSNKNMVARFVRPANPTIAPRITGAIMLWDTTMDQGPDLAIEGITYFACDSSTTFPYVSDGPRRNLAQSRMEFLYQAWDYASDKSADVISVVEAVPDRPGSVSAITTLTPADGSAFITANPTLVAKVDTEQQYSQSAYSIEYQLAKDSAFTTSLITYNPSSRSLQTDVEQLVLGTNTAGVTVTFTSDLPTSYSLGVGLWYYRARLKDAFGNSGAWTTTQSFTVGHPPLPVLTSPKGGGFYAWNGGQRTFTWNFTDPSVTDYQTAYQLIITNTVDGTVVDTGKVTSSAKSFTYTFPATWKDDDCTWTARLWDSSDTAGDYAASEWFTLTDAPVVTITAPTAGAALSTGVPTITFNVTTNGRKLTEYTIQVTQGAQVVFTDRVGGQFNSGDTINYKLPQGYLQNNQSYSVQVFATDAVQVTGASSVVAFSVSWVPPTTPTGVSVGTANYNIEDAGYVLVSWTDAGRDSDFKSWSIWRKADMIDPYTGIVVEAGSWEQIFTDYAVGSLYAYKDFFAPSNYAVSYRVVQTVNRIGQDIDSNPAEVTGIYPQSDGYWLIQPSADSLNADAFKLSIVTGDSFTDEQEEEEFTVIGRGRVVNKGQRLGNKGSLDVQLRNTGGTTARQKRQRLIKLQQTTGTLWLRNPFGDIFKVNVSGISISRIAGVGGAEFCDVTIPYAEVS